MVVIFSMVGAEVATIAAAETPDPERAVQRATNAVAARIAIFFVGSVFLLVVILPWNSVQAGSSPYVAALKQMGIPGADHLMNAVVLTAVLSCLNSGLYSASRVLFVLAAQREAPAQMVKVSRRGVPYIAIVCSSVVGFLCVIMAGVAPGTVFLFLLNSSGAIVLFVYLLIALSQIVLRLKTPPEKLRVKMWFFPVLSFLTLAGSLPCWCKWRSTRPRATSSGLACSPGPWYLRCTSPASGGADGSSRRRLTLNPAWFLRAKPHGSLRFSTPSSTPTRNRQPNKQRQLPSWRAADS